MFYTKTRLGKGTTLITEIHTDNVFTRCLCCGDEVQVNLEDILCEGEGDLNESTVLCGECSRDLLGRAEES